MAKTLLMIHGVGCGGEVWDVMRPVFEAAGWTCIAPTLFEDQRTVQIPPASLSDLTLNDYVEASAALCADIEAETGEKPTVIGHSMGGLIAQKLIERGAAKAGVFLTPAQPADCQSPSLPVLFTFANIIFKPRAKAMEMGHKVWKSGFSWGVLNVVDKARHDEIYALARYDSGKVYRDLGDANADPAKTAVIDEASFEAPTLTIGAGKDRATPIGPVRKTAEKYKKAPVPGDYLEYPDNAHWIVDEPGTDKVSADILDWLEDKAA